MRGSALGFSGFVGITSFLLHPKMGVFGASVWLFLAILTILREIDLHFSDFLRRTLPDRQNSLKIMTLACAGAPECVVATAISGDETDPPAISGTQHEFSCTIHDSQTPKTSRGRLLVALNQAPRRDLRTDPHPIH